MAATRRDIDRQRRLDSCYDCGDDVLLARVRAVAGARRSLAAERPEAIFELRQSLVDLAAILRVPRRAAPGAGADADDPALETGPGAPA